MQLARFLAFKSELEVEAADDGKISGLAVFLKMEDIWKDGSGTTIVDPKALTDCERVLRTGRYWKGQHSPRVLYPINSLQAVVLVEFVSPPRRSTQDGFGKRVRKVLKRSEDAFDARHDQLTGLRNKRTFDDSLNAALQSPVVPPAGSIVETVQLQSAISVLAFDIDHFKQVNDTFGHLYGDIVLQAFATRLSIFVSALEQKFISRAAVSLARTGGEEFAIIVTGDLSTSEVDEIAELVRQLIVNTSLPSDEEWRPLAKVHAASGLELPHVSERRVTTSIGIATRTSARGADTKKAALELKQQADIALYRAKSGGRNTVRRYSDILARYGMVLEHHGDTNVVAIDIGRQVRVAVGQEFIVYHPDFSGERPFIYTDGRTKKRLGGYPRYPSGRIIVFDVQPDISFCKIVESSVTGLFPPGSGLEVVPLGAIAHLIGGASNADLLGTSGLVPAETLPGRIEALAENEHDASVIVCSLDNVDQLADARGTAFINRSLAALYTSLRDNIPTGAVVSQLQATQLAILLPGVNESVAEALATKCLESASAQTGQQAKFSAGFCTKGIVTETAAADTRSALNARHLLDYARYASAASASQAPVRAFRPVMGALIVGSSYKLQRYREALADYRRLRELGVTNANMENVGALAALALGDREMAIDAAKRAMELEPGADVIVANAAYISFQLGDRSGAAALFGRVEVPDALPEVYLGPRALAFASALMAGDESRSASSIRELLSAAITAKGVEAKLKLECAQMIAILASRTDATRDAPVG